MEIFICLVLFVVLLIVIGNFKKEMKKNLQIVNRNVIKIQRELTAYKNVPKHEKEIPTTAVKKENVSANRTASSGLKYMNPAPPKKEEVAIPKKKEEPTRVLKPKKVAAIRPNRPIPQEADKTKAPAKPKRDYEKLIGENWLNKIGIASLVLGIAFFVKYAIDQNWIGEMGRFAIGLLTGTALIGIAHALHKKYRSFSSVLIGGGISTFYFTITIAYQEYQLFSQTAAFCSLIGTTILSTALSLFYDRKELAIIALIGAFSSPLMVSNGSGNYKVLFIYMAIINAGMLFLSYFKNWKVVSQLALSFTALFFGGWLLFNELDNTSKANWSLLFASVYFIQFIGMNLLYNLKRKIKFTAWEFIQFTSITSLYFSATMYIMYQHKFMISRGGFTALFGLFFILLTGFSLYRTGTDKNLINLLIGKGVTFLTLSGALVLESDYTTAFFAIEAVALLLIGRFSNMRILKNSSILVLILAALNMCRTLMLGAMNYELGIATISPILVTGLLFIGALVALHTILKRETGSDDLMFSINTYKNILTTLLFIFSYLISLFELSLHLRDIHGKYAIILILSIYHAIYLIIGLLIGRRNDSKVVGAVFSLLGIVSIPLFLIGMTPINHTLLSSSSFDLQYNTFFLLHFALTGLFLSIVILTKKAIKPSLPPTLIPYISSTIAVISLIVATIELDLTLGYIYSNKYSLATIFSHTQKEGYTILWGIYSFLLMLWGMKKRNQIMRVVSLLIFSATLLKLFVFDIQNISEAGKIIAFILLGILLLVISFMYQKLKQLIVGTTPNEK